MKTKFATLISTVLLLGAVLPAHAQFDYVTNNGTLTITGYTGPGGTVSIPSVIDGLPVTSVANATFMHNGAVTNLMIPASVTNLDSYFLAYDCRGLTAIIVDALNPVYSSVDGVLFNQSQTTLLECPWGKTGGFVIPDSVTNIGNWAFQYCAGLTNVTIPDSVTSIGMTAFYWCSGLTGVTIPDSVTSIGDSAFYVCTGLTSVTIPNSVTSIGNYAFQRCAGLTSVTIGNSVTNIGVYAFDSCFSLTNVTVANITTGNTVSSIGAYAFSYCGNLTSVTLGNGVTIIGVYAFSACISLSSVTIPNSVISIGDWAFGNCGGLTNVTIGNNVSSIGSGAFAYCNGLPNVVIPSSVTTIGEGAFQYSANLAAITVDASNSNYSSVGGVLFDKNQTTLIQCPWGKAGGFTIPNSVTAIGDYAFQYCSRMTNITIGNGVTSIGHGVFFECTNLVSVRIPDSVTSISDWAFADCSSLTSVAIGNNVASIWSETFANCTSLTNVTIGSRVTSIWDSGFANCIRLIAIYFLGDAPRGLGSSVFDGDNNATVYYLSGTTGWGPTFGGLPTALWTPQVQASDGSFGVRTNQFGFNISWASGQVVVVDACTNLANPVWAPLQTNTLTGGSSYFSDPQWTNYSARFYRLRSP